jgi:4-hydroxy-3-polyprenylbenzoate decarboxylase
LEIGAIIEMARKESQVAPCLLFDSIKGFAKGLRIVAGQLNSIKRVALTCGMPTDMATMDLVRIMRKKIKDLKPIAPREVKEGPFMENVWEEKDVDVLRFPTPRYNIGDGGRYIGTGHLTITRDPEEGWLNIGTYRVVVHDSKSLGLYISPGRHARIQMEKYFAQKRPMPVALSLGHDPLLFMASAFEVPYGLSEYDFAGGLKGEPIDVVKLAQTGLQVPASAEVVIEGECSPGDVKTEGPFGEWTGYYASHVREEPVIRIRRMYFRNDPIMAGAPPSRPPTEATFYKSFWRSAMVWEELERAGVPDVVGVYCPPEGNTRLLTVVAIRRRYPGHARQALHIAAACQGGAYAGKWTVVVDDDIDAGELDQVLWAMCTRFDPNVDIDIIQKAWASKRDPLYLPGNFNNRILIDACIPYDKKLAGTFPKVVDVSPELRARLKAKFSHIFS